MSEIEKQLYRSLENVFGFKSFRTGQKEAVLELLSNGRVLCIQPTGHGKSLLYQLPSCLLKGLTVVISPLLALMRDQIHHLTNRFGISSVALNSDQTEEENFLAKQALESDRIKILFIAPEQLDNLIKMEFLLSLSIDLIVVDEAHCISTWGHDFRPSYRLILQFIKAVYQKNNELKILGLTATADSRVESDISHQLGFEGQSVTILRETMNRPNLSLFVAEVSGIAAKLALCGELLAKQSGSGLIYCATRENTEMVAEYLSTHGYAAVAYHAGMQLQAKRELQYGFVHDKYKVVVATNALGMGIDKGNLRFVIHFDIPGSITAYYQEVGRCGRDRMPASGILIFDPADKKIQTYFIESASPKESDFEKVLESIRNAEAAPKLTAIKRISGLHPTLVTTIVSELIEQNFVKKISAQGSQVYQTVENDAKVDLFRYLNQFEVKIRELTAIFEYAKQRRQCRMLFLRNALGDNGVDPCGHCDICKNEYLSASLTSQSSIEAWLAKRPMPISAVAYSKISEGISLLDGRLRAPLFVQFMKERATSVYIQQELIEFIQDYVKIFLKNKNIAGIIPLPSKTWASKQHVSNLLSESLKAPIYADLLSWQKQPLNRQGELLNNDQRHHNVHQQMQAKPIHPSSGAFLLLDDYIGSGNTLKEAGRALRAAGIKNELIPFTLAAVKWHLGKPGFI